MFRVLNTKFTILLIFYPFFCYALYQDVKAVMPWYDIALACVLGLGFGMLIIKIVNPILKYCDVKIAKALGCVVILVSRLLINPRGQK